MVFLTNKNNELRGKLLSDIQNTDEVVLIAPFLTGSLVENLLEKTKTDNILLIVALEYPTDPDRIQDIQSLINPKNVRYIPGENKYLHSKLYILKGRKTIVYIGSANLTDAGFSRNIETMARLILSSNSAEWKSIEEFATALMEQSVVVDEDVLRKYKTEYNLRKNAWNDKNIRNATSRKDDHILEKSKYQAFCNHIKNDVEPLYDSIIKFKTYPEMPMPHQVDRFLEWVYMENYVSKGIKIDGLKQGKGQSSRTNLIKRELVKFKNELEVKDSRQAYLMKRVANDIKGVQKRLSSNSKIETLRKAEFEEFIVRKLHCTHYHGIADRIISNDMRTVRKTLKYLNDNYKEQTIDTLRRNVVGSKSEYYLEGLGQSGFSELMSFWHPDEQYIMNSKSVYSMKYLGFIF